MPQAVSIKRGKDKDKWLELLEKAITEFVPTDDKVDHAKFRLALSKAGGAQNGFVFLAMKCIIPRFNWTE